MTQQATFQMLFTQEFDFPGASDTDQTSHFRWIGFTIDIEDDNMEYATSIFIDGDYDEEYDEIMGDQEGYGVHDAAMFNDWDLGWQSYEVRSKDIDDLMVRWNDWCRMLIGEVSDVVELDYNDYRTYSANGTLYEYIAKRNIICNRKR